MYSSNVVLISWAVILVAAAITALLKKNIEALGLIAGGGAIVAAGVGIEGGLASKAGAVVASLCLLAGTLVTLLGITRPFPR